MMAFMAKQAKKTKKAGDDDKNEPVIAENRKARHNITSWLRR